MINEERVIGQFLELVQVDSETKQERRIADVLKSKFAELGLDVVEDGSQAETGHGAGNLIATLKATADRAAEPFLFTCHMDTVSPGKGIKPVVGEDGWIRSDGTTILGADDKAGVAVLLELIQTLQEQQIPHGQIQFVISVGEESSLRGARALETKYVDAKFGYAIDTGGQVGTICVGAPTQARVEIEIFGKAAHAGVNPEDGISAIQVAGKALARMKLGRIDHETTANIGRFEGGGATNIVPDHVTLFGEARSMSPTKVDAQLQAMKEAVVSACRDFGATGEFRSEVLYRAFLIPEEEPVLHIAQKAAAALGLTGTTFTTGGGSDANIFNSLGIPTVNLAIGYEDIHTTEERIKKDDIIKTAQFALEIVRQSVSR
ncbi:M20/M25/M40 family metallo-hydrolase [Paenibacillus macerans]|uniref:M20/M25/M40 family metallo-hydrolase n=1 Tax=Paenibacillus macerans TaxID=44252 RepID=UPI003D3103AA